MEIYEMLGSGLIRILIAGVILVVGKIALPWLKEQRVYSLVVKFVKAADKLAQSGAISKDSKKKYVIKLLESYGVKITPIVEAFIESAVTELDLAIESGVLLFPDFVVGDAIEEDTYEYYGEEDAVEDEVI